MPVRFHVFAQGGRVGVPLGAARHFTAIRFIHRVSSGMLEPVRGVRVRLVTAFDRANVWTFTRMRTGVDLQVLRSAETLVALETVMRFLVRVCSHVDQHLVSCIKSTFAPRASFPAAIKQSTWSWRSVESRNVSC